MDKFLNIMRMQASLANNTRASSAIGTIVGWDPINYFVNVELYPNPESPTQPTVTGFIPLGTIYCGNGFGIFTPPNIGDIVLVEFQEASFQGAVASVRFATMGEVPNVPNGDIWIVNMSGDYIKLTATGTILINSETVQIGNLADSISGLLNAVAQGVYNSHTHAVIGSATGVPNQQMTPSSLTTNLQAN